MRAQIDYVEMKTKMYIISFRGLKEGKHQFDYKVDSTFFEVYQYEDILDADLQVHLNFIKKSRLLELGFNVEGKATVACDITNELYEQPVNGSLEFVVQFGDSYNDENEDVLILPHETYEIDVAHYIYEMIVLALPSKKVHPGVANGTLKSDILDKLKELQPKEKQNNNIDPRWDKLKGLLTDKKI